MDKDYAFYLDEARNQLDRLELALLQLAQSIASTAETLDEIYRALHSLKSVADVSGITHTREICRIMEELTSRLQKGLSDNDRILLYHGADILHQSLYYDDFKPNARAFQSIAEYKDNSASVTEFWSKSSKRPLFRAPGYLLDFLSEADDHFYAVLFQDDISVFTIRLLRSAGVYADHTATASGNFFLLISGKQPQAIAESIDVPVSQVLELEKRTKTSAVGPSFYKKLEQLKSALSDRFYRNSIRIDARIMQTLSDAVAELVYEKNQLLYNKEASSSPITTETALQQIDRLADMLQEQLAEARLQPLATVFNRFPRFVDKLAGESGKTVDFEIRGKDILVDRLIIEQISEPLQHLVRNSIDHGIELASARTTAGKSPAGKLQLTAWRDNGNIVVELEDDGAGINADNVKQIAVRNGLISREKADRMSISETLNLLFLPRFTTLSKATDGSGKGVGLDAVRFAVEKLGGTITLQSRYGTGVKVRMMIPSHRGIEDVLLFKADGRLYAVPGSVVRTIYSVNQFTYDQSNYEVTTDDGCYPAFALTTATKPRVCIKLGKEASFCLLADSVSENEKLSFIPLPPFYRSDNLVSGTAVTKEGDVALLVNLQTIVPQFPASEEAQQPDEHPETDLHKYLLAECVNGSRYGIDADVIDRILPVDADSMDTIGGKSYYLHNGQRFSVINLDSYVEQQESIVPQPVNYVLIPSQMTNPPAFGFHNLLDMVEVPLDVKPVDVEFIMGSIQINDEKILLPDLFEIAAMEEPERRDTGLRNIKLLVVEDTHFFRTLHTRYLEKVGYRVETAEDGFDALMKAREGNFDLFIVDIIMPRLDGFEFVKAVRKDKRLKNVPCLAVTSLDDDESRDRAHNLGFDGYEVKINKDELLKRIGDLIQEKRNKERSDYDSK
ncbi:MAG: response regulator [Candidatus Cloacimonetes bacterium]|nr:response regulator [Candidatus Cloacimonadota bacterium]